MEVVDFKGEHLSHLLLQDAQQYMEEHVKGADYRDMLECAGYARTYKDGDIVLACVGVAEWEPHRAQAWALVSKDAGRYLCGITRDIGDFLKSTHYSRIETVVAGDFKAGHRWVQMLGFICETPQGMRKYFPDGKSGYLYARIR